MAFEIESPLDFKDLSKGRGAIYTLCCPDDDPLCKNLNKKAVAEYHFGCDKTGSIWPDGSLAPPPPATFDDEAKFSDFFWDL